MIAFTEEEENDDNNLKGNSPSLPIFVSFSGEYLKLMIY
jgi:hypothetical protein